MCSILELEFILVAYNYGTYQLMVEDDSSVLQFCSVGGAGVVRKPPNWDFYPRSDLDNLTNIR